MNSRALDFVNKDENDREDCECKDTVHKVNDRKSSSRKVRCHAVLGKPWQGLTIGCLAGRSSPQIEGRSIRF